MWSTKKLACEVKRNLEVDIVWYFTHFYVFPTDLPNIYNIFWGIYLFFASDSFFLQFTFHYLILLIQTMQLIKHHLLELESELLPQHLSAKVSSQKGFVPFHRERDHLNRLLLGCLRDHNHLLLLWRSFGMRQWDCCRVWWNKKDVSVALFVFASENQIEEIGL